MRNDEKTRPLAGRVYCPSCGYANPSTQSFCTSCGKRIKSNNAIWKIAVAALVLIAGLSWAAYLFSNTVTQPAPTNTAQPLLNANKNTTPAPVATPTVAQTKPTAAPSPAVAPAVAPTPRPTVEPTLEDSSDNIRVWVNTDSGVYHCPGTRWYGATIEGQYMTQKQAQDKGYRPAYYKPCS